MKGFRGRRTTRKLSILFTTTALVLIISLMVNSDGGLTNRVRSYLGITPAIDQTVDFVRIVDVGQGDCILVQSNGRSALIDTGDTDTEIELCSKLNSYGIKRIDAAVITHYHMDHIGGLQSVAERFMLKNLILPQMGEPQEGTDAALVASDVVKEANGGVYTAVQGMSIDVGDFDITVLYYGGNILSDENNRSLFLMVRKDNVKFLLSGDAEKAAEKLLLDEGLDLDCDVLKVGHHGSYTSTSERFLDACTPEYAAISCGKNNTYGHPNEDVMGLLEEKDIELYRTDISGDITFYVEQDDIRVETEY